MNDKEIVDLYWARDEQAIHHTREQYGAYVSVIARNVLAMEEDVQEVVNDVYLRAWMSMPDQRPERLAPFLGRIARGLAIDRYRYNHSKKRTADEGICSFEELEECVSGRNSLEEKIDMDHLTSCLNQFLEDQPKEYASLFLCRYYYMDSLEAMSDYTGYSVSKIKSILHRMRKKLKNYLTQQGISV